MARTVTTMNMKGIRFFAFVEVLPMISHTPWYRSPCLTKVHTLRALAAFDFVDTWESVGREGSGTGS